MVMTSAPNDGTERLHEGKIAGLKEREVKLIVLANSDERIGSAEALKFAAVKMNAGMDKWTYVGKQEE